MIITFSNNKGGVLKTTCATNIAGRLVVAGYKVALLDLDQQANVSTSFMSVNAKHKEKPNIMDYLKESKTANEIFDLTINDKIKNNIIFHNKDSNGQLVVIHGSSEILDYENLIKNGVIKNDKLKELFLKLNKVCDFVIVDTPPAIGSATETAILTSNLVVIPFELNVFSIDGIITLIKKAKISNNKVLLLPTKVTKAKILERNFNDVKSFTRKLNLENVLISNTKISSNNIGFSIVQNECVPQTLSTKRIAVNKKYITEYDELMKEIIQLCGFSA